MRYGHIMPVYGVEGGFGDCGIILGNVADQLMTEEIKVDPTCRTPPLFTAEQLAIERSRFGKVANPDGEMKWRKTFHTS